MATLERIRSKGIFLLIVIGLAMLAFIIGDFLNNSSSFFNQNRTYVGEIDGTPVKYEEFQSNIDEMTDFYKVEYGTNTLDERTNESIRESAWQNILSTRLTECETEKLGLVVNDNELNDALIGERPDPSIMQLRVFANPETGRFDRNQLISIINQLNNEPSDPSQYEQYQLLNNYWNYCKKICEE
jgi:peptidyl-prolyl cis-trans isomerase D